MFLKAYKRESISALSRRSYHPDINPRHHGRSAHSCVSDNWFRNLNPRFLLFLVRFGKSGKKSYDNKHPEMEFHFFFRSRPEISELSPMPEAQCGRTT